MDFALFGVKSFFKFLSVSVDKIAAGSFVLFVSFESINFINFFLDRKNLGLEFIHDLLWQFSRYTSAEFIGKVDVSEGSVHVEISAALHQEGRVVDFPEGLPVGLADISAAALAPQIFKTLEAESQHFFIWWIFSDGDGAVGEQGALVDYFVGWIRTTDTLSAVEEVELGNGHGIVMRHHNS